MKTQMTLRTRNNLNVGMHGEAFASAKYKRFAAFARVRQHSHLAKLLTEIADESRIGSFAKEMECAGLLSDDKSNLEDVIRDKLYNAELYRRFSAEAGQDGDQNAAALFKGLASDDEEQVRDLQKELGSFETTKPDHLLS